MINKKSRNEMRKIRHTRVRKDISGTSSIPRLNVYRSNKNFYAQIIDDEKGVTLASASSMKEKGNNAEVAAKVGKAIAAEAKKKKINKVVFDRAGYLYHGRVKAFADAARENGLEF